MNAVIYHSNTGASKAVAEYIANLLGYPVLDMLMLEDFSFGNLVVVFPVHCQNIPGRILPVLSKITARNVVVLATYGRMCHGNVLQECQKHYGWYIVGGAYVPTSHCYIPNDLAFSRWQALDFVKGCLEAAEPVIFPKCFKNPLADLLPGTRSRLGVRIVRSSACIRCGLCGSLCGNGKCMRCLKCVRDCPAHALSVRYNPFLRLYLKKKPKDELAIYAQETP